ncbi:Sensor histidine kinase TmoS [termite gut metagenome]|uniref:histidine kinase n=1 Tax=termite gut metagenome TaxID=433724 RepID=A0A5J4SLN8_9ZZZZ
MKHRFSFLLFFIPAFSSLNADPNIIVEHYTVEKGLPNNIVNCTLKDSDGFIWFGTWYGLCSFDGVKFKTYNNRDGLLYSKNPPRKIQKIVEDKNGFLWIKTIDQKLYIFDKRNEHFRPIYDDVKKYAENTQIIKIQNTADGEVLLLTKDKNLLCAYAYEGKDEVNIQLLFDSNPYVDAYNSRLKHNVLGETQEYLNWIGMDYKILSYRKGKNLADKPANFLFAKIGATSPEVFTYAYGESTQLWVGDNVGRIYSIDPDLGSVNRYELPDIKEAIKNILVINNNIVYICVSGQGVYEYNIPKDQLRKLSIDIEAEEVLHSFIDKYDKIWFEEGEKALVYYDPLNNTNKRFYLPQGKSIGNLEVQDAGEQGLFFLTPAGEMLMFERESLSMIRMNLLKHFADVQKDQLFFNQMLDKDGILWLSSTASGVYRINFPQKQFRLFDPQTFTKTPHTERDASNMGIRALYQTKDGDIWIGTRWSELYQLDRNGKLKQVFSASNYPVGNVYHIMEDKHGNLWFSTKGNGLVKAIPDSHASYGFRFVRYSNNPNVLSSLSGNDVYFTFQDSKDRIWVGLLGGGLNLLQENDNGVSFKHKYNGFKQYPSYGLYMEVRNMTENNGRIWIGTMDGLMSFDINFNVPEDIIFETYRDQNLSGISDNDIYVLYKDKDSQIWMSAFGGGLNKLIGYDEEKRKPVFKPYGIREGLDNGVVMSIVEDDSGNLWFVTESGISRFDKQTEHFRNYDKYDGFLDVTMEEGSALKTIDNELWLGCKRGILAFSPDKLQSYNHDYATYIIDLKISNTDFRSFKDKMTTKESIKYTDEVILKHEQSMFTIEFAALNYYNQNRISYKYILEGYEKEWHFNGKNRIASYTNVPPGKYKFRVQSVDEANPELISGRTLTITVLPPWWLNWLAYIVYILVGIGLLMIALKVVLFMLKMKNDVYIEQRLSELKIKFFTNISHELRTPLMLIKGPLQELKEKEDFSLKGKWYVELMEKNTNQMLQLVNQILDFRKIQNGKMRLNVSLIDLNEIMDSFYKEFRILSEENEVTYSFHLTDNVIMLWADKEKLNIVIRNIISNAFKFTPSGKSITVSTGITEDEKKCYIRIEDSGVGIPENKLSKIFERFSQGDNSWNPYYQGTGIGLALSKELINLHHGSIVVKSRENQGTVFTVELLLGKKHYKSSEVTFYMGDNDKSEINEELQPAVNEEKPQLQPTTIVFDESTDDIVENILPTLLIVEDNKDLVNLLKWQLESNYNVDVAMDGIEGLKKINKIHPDIVITDQMMPEMSGMEMLKRIRRDFRISHIPVIILTARSDEDDKIKAIKMGANAYITKPFSKEYLMAQLEQLLTERKLFRERVWNQTDDKEPGSYGQYLVKKDILFLEKIHQVIEENLDNSEFNIDDIAANIGLSRSAFFKKLKSLTGFAPVDLIKEIRLSKSVELIKNTDQNISEIAFAVGFKDSGYYTKCFRKKYHKTPTEYRNDRIY